MKLRSPFFCLALAFMFVNSAQAISFSKRVTLPEDNIDECHVAMTTYVHAERGVTLTLYPVEHVAEQSFYHTIQAKLENEELTLFEGNRPAGFFGKPFDLAYEKNPTKRTDKERNILRVQALGRLVEQFIERHNRKPRSLTEVFDDIKGTEQHIKYQLLNTWGNPIIYYETAGSFDIFSEGIETDVYYSRVGPLDLTKYPLVTMREAMNKMYREKATERALAFQYDVMNYNFPSAWVNADISLDMLFTPIEGNTDEENEALFEAQWLFRNEYAMLKLREVIEKNPHVDNIGILYGEGHMQDYHQILTTELGFSYQTQSWLPFLYADNRPPRQDLTPEQIQLRKEDMQTCGNDARRSPSAAPS